MAEQLKLDIRERLRDLNTKGYYLLVALGFIYRPGNHIVLLKWAIILTAIVSVFPIQDYIKSEEWLSRIRDFKILGLITALVLITQWLWYN